MTWNIKTAGLWTDSIAERLSSARALSNGALDALQIGLCEGCPVTPWPYGNATSINPLLVTLGASPGGSPNPNDPDAGENPLELPTAGVRHPHTTYEDAKGFWPKIRCLARTVLAVGTTTAEDAYALFGNMNLDTARSGKASDVQFDPVFGAWVLRTIRDQLQPRFLVCLGLRTSRGANTLLEQAFDGFDRKRPHAEPRLACYQDKRLTFREWDCTAPTGNELKIVHWPQHPSRPEFNAFAPWQAACREFATRHRDLIRP